MYSKEERRERALNYIKVERAITIREIKELLGVGFTTAERVLNNLVIEGEITRRIKTFKGRDYYIYIYEGEAPRGEAKSEEAFKFLFQELQ